MFVCCNCCCLNPLRLAMAKPKVKQTQISMIGRHHMGASANSREEAIGFSFEPDLSESWSEF